MTEMGDGRKVPLRCGAAESSTSFRSDCRKLGTPLLLSGRCRLVGGDEWLAPVLEDSAASECSARSCGRLVRGRLSGLTGRDGAGSTGDVVVDFLFRLPMVGLASSSRARSNAFQARNSSRLSGSGEATWCGGRETSPLRPERLSNRANSVSRNLFAPPCRAATRSRRRHS